MNTTRTSPVTIGAGRSIALSALAVLALTVAGCSSSKSSATAKKTGASTTTVATRATTTTSPQRPGDTAPPGQASVPPTAPPSGANQEFCDSVVQGQQKLGALDPAATAPEQYLVAAKQVFADATAVSPADLKPDMTAVNDYVQGQSSIENLSGEVPAEIEPATKRVQTWFETNCHLDLQVG